MLRMCFVVFILQEYNRRENNVIVGDQTLKTVSRMNIKFQDTESLLSF